MKKVEKTISKHFLWRTVYFDQLQRIENILIQNFHHYKITHGDYEFENIEEIKKFKNDDVRIKEITFSASSLKEGEENTGSRYLLVTIKKKYISIVSSEDDKIDLINIQIQQVFKKNKRWILIILTLTQIIYAVICLLFYLTSMIFMSLNVPFFDDLFLDNKLFFTFLIPLSILVSWAILVPFKFVSIFLVEKNQKPTFFRRNKDMILVGLFVGIICLIIGIVVGKLL